MDGIVADAPSASSDAVMESGATSPHQYPDAAGLDASTGSTGLDAPSARQPADIHVELGSFGCITFYAKHGRFQATCSQPGHGKCIITRYLGKDSVERPKPGRGRPCGLMAAWLHDTRFTCASAHKSPWVQTGYTHAQRQAAREDLKSQPHGDILVAMERPNEYGEPEEPFVVA